MCQTLLLPVLSLEATSQRTLQMLSSMFEKVTMQTQDLPVVPKSHDDMFLCPPVASIGERECANGDRCLGNFIAQVRYGQDTGMAFTCKEFLLPTQYQDFKEGKGLPHRKGKCLLCSRYFQVRYTQMLGLEHLALTFLTTCVCVCMRRTTSTYWCVPSNSCTIQSQCSLVFSCVAGSYGPSIQSRHESARGAGLL